jgi:hypothetical protein
VDSAALKRKESVIGLRQPWLSFVQQRDPCTTILAMFARPIHSTVHFMFLDFGRYMLFDLSSRVRWRDLLQRREQAVTINNARENARRIRYCCTKIGDMVGCCGSSMRLAKVPAMCCLCIRMELSRSKKVWSRRRLAYLVSLLIALEFPSGKRMTYRVTEGYDIDQI